MSWRWAAPGGEQARAALATLIEAGGSLGFSAWSQLVPELTTVWGPLLRDDLITAVDGIYGPTAAGYLAADHEPPPEIDDDDQPKGS